MQSSQRLVSNEGHAHVIYEGDCEDRKTFLHRAAQDGHVPAMYHYALQCDDPAERRRWLRAAAHEGHLPAMYAFALECRKPQHGRHGLNTVGQSASGALSGRSSVKSPSASGISLDLCGR